MLSYSRSGKIRTEFITFLLALIGNSMKFEDDY